MQIHLSGESLPGSGTASLLLDPVSRVSLLRGDGVAGGSAGGYRRSHLVAGGQRGAGHVPNTPPTGRQLVGTGAANDVVAAFTIFGGRSIRQTGGATLVAMLSDTWMLPLASVSNHTDAAVRRWLSDSGVAWERQHIPGYTFSRIYHSAVGVGNQLVVFGGFSRLDDGSGGQSVGYIFNDLLRVALPSAHASAADGDGSGGKWEVATFPSTATLPPVRYDHAATMATRGNAGSDDSAMFLFGGRYDSLQPGLWSVPLADGVPSVAWRAVRATALAESPPKPRRPHVLLCLLDVCAVCRVPGDAGGLHSWQRSHGTVYVSPFRDCHAVPDDALLLRVRRVFPAL